VTKAACQTKMIHRITIGVGAAVAAGAVAYAVAVSAPWGAVLIVAVTQFGAYGIVAGYAWACRRHELASWIVVGVACLTVPLTCAQLAFVSPPVGFGAVTLIMAPVFPQLIVTVLGGYLGFACVEARRLQRQNPNASRGKLTAAGLVAIGLATVIGLAAAL
jgi:hypothetical protein